MAANLDKAESSLSSVSDLAYIRGIDASGNSVKISKADLASVLGAMANNGWVTVSADTLTENGIWSWGSGATDNPAHEKAVLVIFKSQSYISQLAISPSHVFSRFYSDATWTAWKEL